MVSMCLPPIELATVPARVIPRRTPLGQRPGGWRVRRRDRRRVRHARTHAGDKRGPNLGPVDERDAQPDDEIAEFQIAPQRAQARNLAGHDERLHLPLPPVGLLSAAAVRPAFAEAVYLDVADGLGNPVRRPWLAGPQKDLRGRLRQHGLGVVAVAGFELAAALEA